MDLRRIYACLGDCRLAQTIKKTRARLTATGINTSVSSASSARIDLPRRGLDSVLRASLHAYNTEVEIETLLKALRDA